MIKSRTPVDSAGLRTSGILVGVIAVLYLARAVFIPLAFAITLALIVSPAVALLQKLRLGRVLAVALAMTVTIAATAGIGWTIFQQLVGVANELPRYQQNIHHKLEVMRTPGNGALGRATASVQQLGTELSGVPAVAAPPPGDSVPRRTVPAQSGKPLSVQVVDKPGNQLVYLRDVVQPFLTPLGELGFILIFSFFLLVNQFDLRNRLLRVVGLNQLNVMTLALDDAISRVSRYLLMQFAVNAGFGLLCGIGLYLIGVPYAGLWGSVAAILRFVPYVGVAVATVFPLILSLAVFDNWTPPVLVFLLFAVTELVIGNFVEPLLYGAHTGIAPWALLLTTVFWAVLWGYAGLVLSTPLTVCLVVLGRYAPQFSFLHIILGDEDVLGPEARIYQRLLAMDDQEAREVAELYLTENSLPQLYDSVIRPALAMAEHDRHKGTLDPGRKEFLFLSIREMLVEFSEKTPHLEVVRAAGRTLVVPASDEADEITAAMFAQVLEQAGHAAISFPLDSAVQQTIALMEPGEQDTLCISAVPPFAFARAITLSRQLQTRFPRTKLVVGVWGFTGDAERALSRFQPSRPDMLVTSFAEGIQFVAEGSANPQAESIAAENTRFAVS